MTVVAGGWAFQTGRDVNKSVAHFWRDGFAASLCGQATRPTTTPEPDDQHRFPDDCRTCRYYLDRLT